ncbi:MAG TPA: HypC/HybG/HupF family hydrogenase formation chaperone [Candidatus Latescibacteria bacterium]|nr:HypC/HybG/HupF family hydrogenase formation chaperone [Candidatus Latescibacterota bacterium]
MCLAIPIRIVERHGIVGIGEVGGVRRQVDLQLLDDVQIGDYVIVHAGFAIQKLDEEEAAETLSLLSELISGDS